MQGHLSVKLQEILDFFKKKQLKYFELYRNALHLCRSLKKGHQQGGFLAQLVEHRTENPCVRGSNPRETTRPEAFAFGLFFVGKFYKFFLN